MQHLVRDVGYGWRGLARDRVFAFTTVATLAVGLALVTVFFAVFNAYVLRPYAVRDPYSLHEIRWRSRDAAGRMFRWSDYQELRSRRDLFDGVIAERNRGVSSNGRELLAAFVSGDYFEVLGGRVLLGRGLAGFDADVPGGDPVAVLSHRLWTRMFDAEPGAIGRSLRLNGHTFMIVGIMHEEFVGLNETPPDLWVPVTMHGMVIGQDLFGATQPRELAVIGRLRSGVTAAQAQQALTPGMARMVERSDAVRAEILLQATPALLSLELLAVVSPVFAAFGLVLAAACANVSNVMLARATTRQREIGIRLSIGASRGRVVRQLLTEGLLVAVLAGVAGLGIASVMVRAGLSVFFLTLPPSAAAGTRVIALDFDYRVFMFTFLAAGAATLVFALLPALQATRMTLTHALRGEFGAVRSSRLRDVLVMCQVGVSLVLLVGAATLLRNGAAVGSTDIGLDAASVISITQREPGANMVSTAAKTLADDSRIAHVAITSRNPLLGQLPKLPLKTAEGSTVATSYMFVSPEYFTAVGIPILRGRAFTEDEGRIEAKVAIVSAATAKLFWPGLDPLGRTVRVWIEPEQRPDLMRRLQLYDKAEIDRQSSDMTIVGIARDVVSGIVYEGQDVAHLYLPTGLGAPHARALLVRPRAAHGLNVEALQGLLQKVHPNPLAFDPMPLADALAIQMFPLKVASWIGLVLAGVALALSVSGLYGIVTYGLSQRTKEIGIRIALGATSGAIVRLFLTDSARLVAVGAGLGLAVSFALLATLRAFVRLPNLSVLDASAFAAGAAVVFAAAALATFYPVTRAARVDPSETLRADG